MVVTAATKYSNGYLQNAQTYNVILLQIICS